MDLVGINDFAKRQLEADFVGTKLTRAELTDIADMTQVMVREGKQQDGYAPFCKIVKLGFPLTCPIVLITDENEHLLKTRYFARRDSELPVLQRYFPLGSMAVPIADHVDVILYTKEQLQKENEKHTGAELDIISVNAELETSSPMTPITIMRNALGPEQGGSGKELDRTAYDEAVKFWSQHAMIE